MNVHQKCQPVFVLPTKQKTVAHIIFTSCLPSLFINLAFFFNVSGLGKVVLLKSLPDTNLSFSGLSSCLQSSHSKFYLPKCLRVGLLGFFSSDNYFTSRNCHTWWDTKPSCFSLLSLTPVSINCFGGRYWLACCPRSLFLILMGCFKLHTFSLLFFQNHIFKARFNTTRGRIMRVKSNHLFFMGINRGSSEPSLWQRNRQFP